MFIIENENTKFPIKVWLEKESDIDESCLLQAYNLANLPFIHKWVALMPDTHTGMGMPIGGVIATKDVIVPNAVGVDIGCGMGFVGTDIKVSQIKDITTGNGTFIQAMVGDILRNIPVGRMHQKKPQECLVLDRALEEKEKYIDTLELFEQIQNGYYQIGTLGGGNHFIEIQEDENGFLGIMLHSGSRNFGKRICDLFHTKARELNEKWYSRVPDDFRLAFLPIDSKEGKKYINWMNLALDFAYENRKHMMNTTKLILERYMSKFTNIDFSYTMEINCHHNYASHENHYGEDVWVHRKGATRVREKELAVIPGAMGSYSYVVEGFGNKLSFDTSSHGAGRKYSRTVAMEKFTVEEVMVDLKNNGIILGKHSKKDVPEESRFAYKDIDAVMENQKDLVRPIKKLKTIGVVKG